MVMGIAIIILILQMEAPSHRQLNQITDYSRWTLALSYNVNHCILMLSKEGFSSTLKRLLEKCFWEGAHCFGGGGGVFHHGRQGIVAPDWGSRSMRRLVMLCLMSGTRSCCWKLGRVIMLKPHSIQLLISSPNSGNR